MYCSLEDLLGEIGHGHAGDAHALVMDVGFRATRRAALTARLKRRVQQRPTVSLLDGRLIGLLHLGENLRLADDHAVEAARHAEQVRRRRPGRPARTDASRFPSGRAGGNRPRRPPPRCGRAPRRARRPGRARRGCRSTGAPPRRRDSAAPRVERGASLPVVKRQALANLDRRVVMATADYPELHRDPLHPLWIPRCAW